MRLDAYALENVAAFLHLINGSGCEVTGDVVFRDYNADVAVTFDHVLEEHVVVDAMTIDVQTDD